MWKCISDWHSRRVYRSQQDKIQRCHLYVVDGFGLALPVISTAVTFPEEPFLKILSTSMLQAEAVGASVVGALDYAGCAKNQSITMNYKDAQVDFLDGMERHRKSIGIGKRRFESHMQLVSITRGDGEMHLKKNNPAHGRFAFEGTKLANDHLVITGTVSEAQIGQSVLTLLGRAV